MFATIEGIVRNSTGSGVVSNDVLSPESTEQEPQYDPYDYHVHNYDNCKWGFLLMNRYAKASFRIKGSKINTCMYSPILHFRTCLGLFRMQRLITQPCAALKRAT